MEKESTRTANRPAGRDGEVASRFLELLGTMKRYVRERLPPLADGGMSEERFRTLLTLRYYGKGYLKTLAAHDGLSSSALCIMLNRMVEEKLAARTEDPDDRRNVSYELTPAGSARLEAEFERRAELVRSGLGRMGDAERARFARAIETVMAGVEKLKSPERPSPAKKARREAESWQ
ncbi:MAG: MarR family winged helix-turn-helix transcriptional regulator [Spirochaetia bacterium]